MSAIAGIDQALWDLKGKALGQPVHRLLGGPVRDSIRAYSWAGAIVWRHRLGCTEGSRERVHGTEVERYRRARIFRSFAKIDRVVTILAALRGAVGNDFGIGVDFHGRVHRPMLKALFKELEPFRLMFVEEPVHGEHLEVLNELVSQFSIPIALGERLYSRWDFKKVFESGHVDLIQPDVLRRMITETLKIAAMAECYDVALALHCPRPDCAGGEPATRRGVRDCGHSGAVVGDAL